MRIPGIDVIRNGMKKETNMKTTSFDTGASRSAMDPLLPISKSAPPTKCGVDPPLQTPPIQESAKRMQGPFRRMVPSIMDGRCLPMRPKICSTANKYPVHSIAVLHAWSFRCAPLTLCHPRTLLAVHPHGSVPCVLTPCKPAAPIGEWDAC